MNHNSLLETLLSLMASAAEFTANLAAGTASSWGNYQAEIPEELREKR